MGALWDWRIEGFCALNKSERQLPEELILSRKCDGLTECGIRADEQMFISEAIIISVSISDRAKDEDHAGE